MGPAVRERENDGRGVRPRAVVIGIACVLATILAAPVLVLMGAFWLSGQTHHFGSYDPRYFLLIHGTTVHKLGLHPNTRGSVAYAARGQDGNSPAYAQMTFETMATSAHVLDYYAGRCQAIDLLPLRKLDSKNSELLECSGTAGDDIGVTVEGQGAITRVRIGGWVF